jgi:hypothetical protein
MYISVEKQTNINDLFEQMKIDLSKNHNTQISKIVKEKKSQIMSILDSLEMQKFKEKYSEGSPLKMIKKSNLSKHKSSYFKDEKNIPITNILINNLENKELYYDKKESDRTLKKQVISSRNTTQLDTNDITKSKKFFTKSDLNGGRFRSTNSVQAFKTLDSPNVIDERIEEIEAFNFNQKSNPTKKLTKVSTVANFNRFFTNSLMKNSMLNLNNNQSINSKLEENLVNGIFTNCFENGKNIESDFKTILIKESNHISRNLNMIHKSLDKDYTLTKLIPIDLKKMKKRKNEYIFLEGKKFDLNFDVDEDKARKLDKLSYMSPNLAYNFRHDLVNKFDFENSEELPFKVKKKKVEKKNEAKPPIHNHINKLLKESEFYKIKLMNKLEEKLRQQKKEQLNSSNHQEFKMLF